jgi:hypothetical protein
MTAWRSLSCFEPRHTDPVFSTMTSVIAPCLSALLLPLLLLLLLDSSTYDQVRVGCALSGAAAVARRRRAAHAVKNAVVASVCGRRASNPSLVVSARRCCGSSIHAVRVCGDTCERSLCKRRRLCVARATPSSCGPKICERRRAQVARQRAPCAAMMQSFVCVHAHHELASQALPREPAAAPACAIAAALIAAPPELPSPALTACLCSAVSESAVNQHRAHDGLRAAVPAWAANRANPFTSIIAVRLARSQRWLILLRTTVAATLIVYSQTFSSIRASPYHGCAMGVPRDPALGASVTHGRTAPPLIKCGSEPGHRSSTSGSSVTNTSYQYPLRGQLAVLDIKAVTTGWPSDRGPRRAVTTATLTHSGHRSAFCAFRIHRYGVVVSARHSGGAV